MGRNSGAIMTMTQVHIVATSATSRHKVIKIRASNAGLKLRAKPVGFKHLLDRNASGCDGERSHDAGDGFRGIAAH
jgi:hypothetical protein